MNSNSILPYSESKEYKGTYRGVNWMVKNWGYTSEEPVLKNWNYYIFLHLNRFEDKELAEKFWCDDKHYDWGVVPDYYNVPVIHQIDFHGGVTFYEKTDYKGRAGRTVKIGCDYMHLHDEGHRYDLQYVLYDVRNTIDQFFGSGVQYLRWCQRNGHLYREEQGTYNERGEFRSSENETPVLTKDEQCS